MFKVFRAEGTICVFVEGANNRRVFFYQAGPLDVLLGRA
jgi:hypothetical protein